MFAARAREFISYVREWTQQMLGEEKVDSFNKCAARQTLQTESEGVFERCFHCSPSLPGLALVVNNAEGVSGRPSGGLGTWNLRPQTDQQICMYVL